MNKSRTASMERGMRGGEEACSSKIFKPNSNHSISRKLKMEYVIYVGKGKIREYLFDSTARLQQFVYHSIMESCSIPFQKRNCFHISKILKIFIQYYCIIDIQ